LNELATVAGPFPGVDGFLGSRASFGMDVVLVGLWALLPVLGWSIHLVRNRRNYTAHKRLQLLIAAALLAAIIVFEIDVRILSDWRLRAAPSPSWPIGVLATLGIHLVFAISTLVLLVTVLWGAWRQFPTPPRPAPHSPRHRLLGRLAAIDLILTAVTGTFFYWLAFVSTR
jgi:putative membrane protein